MNHMSKFAAVAASVAVTFGAQAASIDFEPGSFPGGPGFHPGDNAPITDEYLASLGIRFSMPVGLGDVPTLEKVGENDAIRGFLSTVPTPFSEDRPRSGGLDQNGNPYTSDLGEYFLRAGSPQQQTGDVRLIIEYLNGVTQASGEVWDIDAGAGGTQRFRVVAMLDNGDQLVSISPIGIDQGSPASLDSRPWLWGFTAPAGRTIEKIAVNFVESDPNAKTSGVGLAFDNFFFDTNTVTTDPPVPAPNAALGGLVLGALGITRRRRRA